MIPIPVNVRVIKPVSRNWRDWLAWEQDIPEITTSPVEASNFDMDGRYLLLIHGATRRARQADADEFAKLPADIQARVWLLYYSGAGLRGTELSGFTSHLHCVAYPIGSDLGEAARRCFRRALDLLRKTDAPDPKALWSALYPPENVAAVALLALLCAAPHASIGDAVSELVTHAKQGDSDLARAYTEYCGVATLFASTTPWSYQTWLDCLDQRRYDELRGELDSVLGHAPD